jgi:hypothetical protein
MQIDGSCHCGAITFTADIDESQVLACNCTDCQVLSGSPFRAVVVASIEKFAVHGAPKSYVKVADSGNRRAQMFCPECGTPLYACAPDKPTWVSIRLGCVTQRRQLKPAKQIWLRSALPWLRELSSIPGSTEQEAFVKTPLA